MAVNKRLIGAGATAAAGGLTPSEHFGVVLYEGDGTSSHSINGGKFGAAAYFDGGSSDKILIGNNLKNIFFDEFSISTWFYITEINNYQTIVGNTDSARDRGILLYVRGDNNKLIWNASETGAPGPYFNVTSTVTLSANTWYHAVATFNNSTDSDGAKLYINGSLDNSGQARTADIESSNNVHIGNSGLALDWPFHGKIDQTRFFTKVLSSSEVSTLYAETVDTVESLDPLSEDTTETLQVLGDSSCIATYRFENNEDDESGNFDGTGVNVQYAAGRYGQAASFNGSSSYVGLPDLSSTTAGSSATFSASFWIKPNNLSGVQSMIQLAGNDTTFTHFVLQASGSSMQMDFYGVAQSFSGQGSLVANQWQHIVIVNNGSSATVYLNTTASSAITHNKTYAGSYAMIGGRYVTGSLYSADAFDGKIDQVRIFNKALSAAEVTTLYNENSLVASYRFEGNANDDTRNNDGSASNVTYEYGLNFTPDLVWIKPRSFADNHALADSTRGTGKVLVSNTTSAENNLGLASFDTGGFTLANPNWNNINSDGQDFVAWCWKANGGTTSSNTDGTITSTVQANQDAGFSIVKWTGTQTNGSIGHGLTAAPEMLIVKDTTNTYNWYVFIKPSGATNNIRIEGLNTTAAGTVQNSQFTTTSSLIENLTIYASLNTTGATMLAYAFHSVDGFSKIGSYTGNGSSNIIETGFEPAFVMFKRTNAANNWLILDNKRNTSNPRNCLLIPNATNVEDCTDAAYNVNFLSNGFELLSNGTSINDSGGTYIFMAFAADPDTEAPTVAKSFSTVTYTGTGATNSIDGLGFEPSFTWIKGRTNTASHQIFDTIRGATKGLNSDANIAEFTNTSMLTSFDSDGFTLGGQSSVNGSGVNYVAWAWKADDNEPTINTEGSIDSIVSANANAGFSIVKYEGTGSNTTIGHSLSAAPEMMIIKNLDQTDNWVVYHSAVGTGQFLSLNSTDAASGSGDIFGTPNDTGVAPTSTVFTVGSNHKSGANGENYIAYCFHSVSGYSKFGSYTGNGSGSGQTITTGFQPDWIILKCTSVASEWVIVDSVRGDAYLLAESSGAEVSPYTAIDFLSTGFKLTGTSYNESGRTFIYWTHKIN